MLAKIRSHPHLAYFVAYCTNFLVHGIHITALGPYIPYISAQTGLVQTEYSFLFTCRSVAMIAGALLIKWLQTRPSQLVSNHRTMQIAAVFITIFCILFSSTTDTVFLALWMLSTAFFYTFIEINTNVCALMINPIQDMEFFLLILHGLFSVGGLLGPLLVSIFAEQTYFYIGLLELVIFVYLSRMPSPETIGLRVN